MVVNCAVVFPLTNEERATARTLEWQIDNMLCKAGTGTQEPIIDDPVLSNQRIHHYLVDRYARAGWIVKSEEQSLSFAPNMKFLASKEAPYVVSLVRRFWQY